MGSRRLGFKLNPNWILQFGNKKEGGRGKQWSGCRGEVVAQSKKEGVVVQATTLDVGEDSATTGAAISGGTCKGRVLGNCESRKARNVGGG